MTDLIKREDAIKAIRECRPWHFCELIPVLSAVKDIPSVEPKRGEWIRTERMGTFKLYDCSACGIHIEAPWSFCPNCGARMKGADDE